jgi:hypothetical protein
LVVFVFDFSCIVFLAQNGTRSETTIKKALLQLRLALDAGHELMAVLAIDIFDGLHAN